jgi:hypothetical protein
MQDFVKMLPYLAPIIVLGLALEVTALVDLYRRERANGPKWVWLLVILFVNLLGPIIYFVAGRRE